MSTHRKVRMPYRERGRCSWCGTRDLPKGRTLWCSQECVDAWKIVGDPAFVRQKVYERDRGICSICGCDADKEFRRWRTQANEIWRLANRLVNQSRWNVDWDGAKWVFRNPGFHPTGKQQRAYTDELMAKYNPGNWTTGCRNSGWDADHIVPVIEGGGECTLENYRTLCHPCHKEVTAALAARRAKSRKRRQLEVASED